MKGTSIHLLYSEAARGRLVRHLDTNPGLATTDVAQALDRDFRQAVEYGDLSMAVIAGRACSEVLDRIGEHRAAIALHIDLFRLQMTAAGTAAEFASLRDQALGVGARAQDHHWAAAQAECWLLAIECAQRQATSLKGEAHLTRLLTALRDLADVAELIAAQPPAQQSRSQLGRLAALLASVSADAYAADWEEQQLLGLRALLVRCARAGERVIPNGLVNEVHSDPQEARVARERLVRLFLDNS